MVTCTSPPKARACSTSSGRIRRVAVRTPKSDKSDQRVPPPQSSDESGCPGERGHRSLQPLAERDTNLESQRSPCGGNVGERVPDISGALRPVARLGPGADLPRELHRRLVSMTSTSPLSFARLARLPAERLSRMRTAWPSLSRRAAMCDPMKPTPPVTMYTGLLLSEQVLLPTTKATAGFDQPH